ncbi:MAG: hypothetical protein LBG80_20325 [Bacteroidales bacterium]|jgi:hypothetical protein|nr:hypothetical protein [Bacteroidales bacterium]
MKKYNVLLMTLLLTNQLVFCQHTDSTKIDIFMTQAQLKEIGLNVNFISSFVETPNRYIFLSSAQGLYVLGKEGIMPVTYVPQQAISSFTITTAGDLYAILDKKLCFLDSVSNFQEVIDLPNSKMKLSAGKNALYIYDSEAISGTNKYTIYRLFPDNNYQKIIETPASINAVTEVEGKILFASENKVYCIDVENKVYSEITYLQNQNEKIISIAMDYSHQSLYFSSLTAIFRLKEGKVDCVNDQFGGLLQCDEVGLVIFNPIENFLVRMRNTALFSLTSQNTVSTAKQTVPASNTPASVSTLPPVNKPNQSTSSSANSSSSTKQTITYNAPTLLISTSGEKYEAKEGYYFVGTLKDGKIEQGTLYDSNRKPVKTFFIKK